MKRSLNQNGLGFKMILCMPCHSWFFPAFTDVSVSQCHSKTIKLHLSLSVTATHVSHIFAVEQPLYFARLSVTATLAGAWGQWDFPFRKVCQARDLSAGCVPTHRQTCPGPASPQTAGRGEGSSSELRGSLHLQILPQLSREAELPIADQPMTSASLAGPQSRRCS